MAAGLTFEQMLETVVAMGAGAERTDQARFLWRATGLLIRNHKDTFFASAYTLLCSSLTTEQRHMVEALRQG